MAKNKLTVISDASPLIVLSAVQKLELLKKIFQEITIPGAVYREVIVQGENKPGTRMVEEADWIIQRSVKNPKAVKKLRKHYHLGQGEAEVIILAEQLQADWIIIDEIRARRAAVEEGRKIIGTLGILLLAKEQGLIDTVKELLQKFMLVGFHVSDLTYEEIITKAGEK
jgi:predicted nucleic acid-binding protein